MSARFADSTHSLERQPAQAGLRVDLGAREHTENVAAVHTQTPESSRRRRSSSPPPSTALGGSAATRAIRVWDRAGQRRRTRPRPSRPAPPNGCSGHPAGSSSGRLTVPPSTDRVATWTTTTTTPRGGDAGRETTPHRPACAPSHFALRRGWGRNINLIIIVLLLMSTCKRPLEISKDRWTDGSVGSQTKRGRDQFRVWAIVRGDIGLHRVRL